MFDGVIWFSVKLSFNDVDVPVVTICGTGGSFLNRGGVKGVDTDLVLPTVRASSECIDVLDGNLNIFFNLTKPELFCSDVEGRDDE